MNVLALSAHTDDVETGAGGYLSRLIEQGANVYSCALSTGNPETGATRDEFMASMQVLNVRRMMCLTFETRRFQASRQEVLDALIQAREWAEPDLVLVPSTMDIHQDHQVVVNEAMRAFRTQSILGYELPWPNVRGFTGTFYVPLAERHIELKLKSINAYVSQRARHYAGDYMRHVARMRGGQIKEEYAELFEVIKWVVR